jgi:hypothetical protein
LALVKGVPKNRLRAKFPRKRAWPLTVRRTFRHACCCTSALSRAEFAPRPPVMRFCSLSNCGNSCQSGGNPLTGAPQPYAFFATNCCVCWMTPNGRVQKIPQTAGRRLYHAWLQLTPTRSSSEERTSWPLAGERRPSGPGPTAGRRGPEPDLGPFVEGRAKRPTRWQRQASVGPWARLRWPLV